MLLGGGSAGLQEFGRSAYFDLTRGRFSEGPLRCAVELSSVLLSSCLMFCAKSTVSHRMKGCPGARSSSLLQ